MSLVELQNVTYTYSEDSPDAVVAVKDVSLKINEGELIAMVGHNGSGKSTIAKLLNGLLIPCSGVVTVGGLNTSDAKNLFDIRKTLGVVFQNPDNQMVATIIEDDIAFGPENLGLPSKEIQERVDWALSCVGMSEYKKGMPFRLSGGQKQRIAIAGVLAIKPKVMVLDESTAMLDPVGRKEVMEVIKKLNREEKMTVIMITHFMEEALYADRIIVMDNGKVLLNGDRRIFNERKKLYEAGLDLPISIKITERLREKGLPVKGDIITEEELIGELCRLL